MTRLARSRLNDLAERGQARSRKEFHGQGAGGRAAFGDYVEGYQNPPINWGINTHRKVAFFEALRTVTGN